MVVTALGLLLGGRADTGAVRSGAKHGPGRGRGPRRGPRRPFARGRRGRRRRGRGRPGRAGPQRLGRGPLAGVRRRRLGAGRRRSPRSPSRWWPCTASPTSTGCSGPAPSARRSTASAASGPAALLRDVPPTCTTGWRATERELDEVVGPARERAREADLLRFGLGEVEAVAPAAGRGRRARRRGVAARVRRHAAHRRRAGPRGALERAGRSPTRWPPRPRPAACLDGVREHDPEAGELADRLAEISLPARPTWPPTSRRTPRASTPTRPGSPPSRSGGPR